MAALSSERIDAAPRRYYAHAAQIFADVARAHSGRRALVWSSSDATSYQQLDRVSNQIARRLLAEGVRKRNPVCLCLEKSLAAYASILACLKIGSPYFVVDPSNPRPRTETILDRCQPAAAVVGPSVDRSMFQCPVVLMDEAGEAAIVRTPNSAVELPWEIDGSDPAYIMFTSGSTGAPKGVTISHSNLVNFIAWSQQQFHTRPDDVFTNVNPLFFDNSVFDIYSSLFAGAALVPFTAATMRDPQAIVSRIEALGCTVYFSVPSLLVYLQTMKLVSRDSFPSLEKIIFGGEGYPKAMLARLFDAVGDRVGLFNVYGPTECTCICSVYPISARDFVDLKGYAPLGCLIDNFSYVIVDDANRPVGPGETGELCLGGPCVGLGYYADPELTAKVFVQNPTHDRFFDRMYKTGDLVRYDAGDGYIHFVGRADSQIKHQGYRIELGEIEHALTSLDGVDEAAAVYLPTATGGRIVAVVASKQSFAPGAVRKALLQTLPRYMVPEKVMVVAQLLKNANGKIDRKAIAASLDQEQG